jgi:hypothetical protein
MGIELDPNIVQHWERAWVQCVVSPSLDACARILGMGFTCTKKRVPLDKYCLHTTHFLICVAFFSNMFFIVVFSSFFLKLFSPFKRLNYCWAWPICQDHRRRRRRRRRRHKARRLPCPEQLLGERRLRA